MLPSVSQYVSARFLKITRTQSLCGSFGSRNNNARHVGVYRIGSIYLGWYNRDADRLTLFAFGLHLTSESIHVNDLGSFEWPWFTRFDGVNDFFDNPLEARLSEFPSFGGVAVLMTTVLGFLISIPMGRMTSGGRGLGHIDRV